MSVAEKTLNMQFSISWRPFFLDPNLPGGEGKDKLAHYKLKFGADRVAQMMPRMVQTFAEEGIPGYSIEGNVGNTMDSHRLLEYALRQGGPAKQDKLVEVLFERYFLKGQALSSRQVLLDAAAAADLDGAEALLASDQLHDEVWSEVESAYQAGVSGVPHFKIDGGGPGRELSGGQPPEAFLHILRSLPKTTPIASVGSSAGGSASLASTVLGFRVGGTVAIQGVLAKPELNGQTGTVLGAQGAERVQVRLASGVEMALKPTNLAESSESGL